MPNNVLVLPRIGDQVGKHQHWQYQGQNYVARLTGNDPKYGFRRNFLQLAKHGDGKYYFSIVDFVRGGFYEIRSRGVSGAFIVNSIYECVDVSNAGVKLAEVDRSHVVRELTHVPVRETQPVQTTLGDAPKEPTPLHEPPTGVPEACVTATAMSKAAAVDFEYVTSTVLKKPEDTSEKLAIKFPSTDARHVAMQLLAITGSKEAAKAAIDAVEQIKPGCVVVAKV